MKLGFNGSEAS